MQNASAFGTSNSVVFDFTPGVGEKFFNAFVVFRNPGKSKFPRVCTTCFWVIMKVFFSSLIIRIQVRGSRGAQFFFLPWGGVMNVCGNYNCFIFTFRARENLWDSGYNGAFMINANDAPGLNLFTEIRTVSTLLDFDCKVSVNPLRVYSRMRINGRKLGEIFVLRKVFSSKVVGGTKLIKVLSGTLKIWIKQATHS